MPAGWKDRGRERATPRHYHPGDNRGQPSWAAVTPQIPTGHARTWSLVQPCWVPWRLPGGTAESYNGLPPHLGVISTNEIKTRISNENYLRSHPEVELLLGEFLREVFLKRPVDIREFAAGTCEYKSQVFGFGETWLTKDCYQCICLKPFGVGCCDDGQQPVDYPEWCEVIRTPDSCSVAVVMRGNNKIPCIDNPILNNLHGSEKQAWKEPHDLLF
ncbi:MSMP protein, partial [Polypterus senegalus]